MYAETGGGGAVDDEMMRSYWRWGGSSARRRQWASASAWLSVIARVFSERSSRDHRHIRRKRATLMTRRDRIGAGGGRRARREWLIYIHTPKPSAVSCLDSTDC